jgi:hypothetical protein
MATGIKYLTKKVAKWTYDVTATKALYSSYTFDAADIVTPNITILAHPYKQNDMVGVILTGTTGVTATTPAVATAYWVIYVDKDTIALATTLALAKAGTKTTLTAGSAVDVFLVPNIIGAVKSGIVIPKGAIVTNVTVDIDTTFQSYAGAWGAGNVDKAVLGLGLETVTVDSEDLIVGVAIETGTPWDSGRHGTLVGTPVLGASASVGSTALLLKELVATKYLDITVDSELTLNIKTDCVGAGKMNIYVEYMI